MINPFTMNPIDIIKGVVVVAVISIGIYAYKVIDGLKEENSALTVALRDTEDKLMIERINSMKMLESISLQNSAIEKLRSDRDSGIKAMENKVELVEKKRLELVKKVNSQLEPEMIVKYVDCDSNTSGSDKANEALSILLGDIK
jgi:hypothetical protein